MTHDHDKKPRDRETDQLVLVPFQTQRVVLGEQVMVSLNFL